MPDLRLALRLWPYMRRYGLLLSVACALTVVSAVASLWRPLIMRDTIDLGMVGRDGDALFRGGVIFGVVLIGEQLVSFIQILSLQVLGARAMADLRAAVFRHLHQLRLAWFDRQPVGRLVTRVTNDVDAIQEVFSSGVLNALGDVVRLLGIVVLMLALDWRLALLAFATLPPVALMARLVRRRLRDASSDIRSKTARLNAFVNEQVIGLPVVQAHVREEAAAAEFSVINRGYRDANLAYIKWDSLQDAAIDMVQAVGLALIIVSLGYRVASFGTIVAFNAYLLQFFEPIGQLAQRYTLLQSAFAGAERVFGVLDVRELDAPVTAGAPPLPASEGLITFEGVSFHYKPDQPVLSDLSLTIRRGEKVALVGPSGSGKTTLASLLLRLYEPQSGVIRLDGIDLRGMGREELRRRFAVVPQDVVLFPGSVAENVALEAHPDEARVAEALSRMSALDYFLKRPGGLKAPVGDQGGNLSAGERQLVAFARALYRDVDTLILDEATASIDSDTEARVQAALERVLEGRSALIIAHRLSTVRRADRILVLHRGRVVEQGSHDQLLARGGLYARLVELYFSSDS